MNLKRATYKKIDLTLLDHFNNSQKNPIDFAEFRSGDEIEVQIRVTDSTKEKIDTFKGICLGRYRKHQFDASFLVRTVIQGHAVERKICINNPNLMSIKVIERYKSRQSKMYYLREYFGKQLRFKVDVKRAMKGKKLEKEQLERAKSATNKPNSTAKTAGK